MLKLNKKKGSEVKAEISPENTDDDVGVFLNDWLQELQENRPDLFDALSKPLIIKSALDEALSGGGVYRIDTEDVIADLEKKAPTTNRGKGKGGKGKGSQSQSKQNKSRGNKRKGLKKPHTDI